MPDTLIDSNLTTTKDEPVQAAPGDLRPTVIDDGTGAPQGPGAPQGGAKARPRSRAGCWIGAALAVLVLAAAAALGAYFFLWRYEPTAHRHIPGGANIVLRLEAADIALFGPVRKHLWPLLEESTSGKTRGSRLKDATGVSPATDLREILVASTDATSWVVLAGGRIPKGRFVRGLEKVAREEGWAGFRLEGDLLRGPAGVAVGQAADGTIVIGTDAEIVRAALHPSDEWKRLHLPQQGAVTFAITQGAWEGIAGEIGGLLPRGGRGLFRRIGYASGSIALSDAPSITMRIVPVSGETAAALAGDVETMLGDLKLVTLLLPDTFGEKRALQSAQPTAKADAVEVRAAWPYDGLDRACEQLGQLIRRARTPAAPGPPGAPAPR